jgi:membrane protein YqaA with SNARE-associated domain
MKLLRRLYDWVLRWADTPYGMPALFLLAFAESSFFPIPPDVLLLALALGMPSCAFRFAAVASLGSVLGGALGYGIGLGFWDTLGSFFYQYVPMFTAEGFSEVQQLFARYNFWVVFTAGFTPIPYKVITIGAGVFHVNFGMFMVASLLSRSLRFFLLAVLVYCWGQTVRLFVEKYFNYLTFALMVLGIGGFLIVSHFT